MTNKTHCISRPQRERTLEDAKSILINGFYAGSKLVGWGEALDYMRAEGHYSPVYVDQLESDIKYILEQI